eukprot:jgi/Bigna1/69603/fgenesh1_pg.9_\
MAEECTPKGYISRMGGKATDAPQRRTDEAVCGSNISKTTQVDGFVVIDSGLEKAVLDLICNKVASIPTRSLLTISCSSDGYAPRRRLQFSDWQLESGALTSILGPNYHEHAHRYLHDLRHAEKGGPHRAQDYHKDTQSPMALAANHHPNWAMVLFFPQETPKIMGPTGVIAGTQYDTRPEHMVRDEENKLGRPVDAKKAGTCAIVHFDLVHRGNINLNKNKVRYMLKLVFARSATPTEPSWKCKDTVFRLPKQIRGRYKALPIWFPSLDSVCKSAEGKYTAEAKRLDIDRFVRGMMANPDDTPLGGETPHSFGYWLAARGGMKGISALICAAGSAAVEAILQELTQTLRKSGHDGKKQQSSSSPPFGTLFEVEPSGEEGTFLVKEAGSQRYVCLDEGAGEWEGARGLIVISRRGGRFKPEHFHALPIDSSACAFISPRRGEETRIHEDGLGDGKLRLLEGADDDFTEFVKEEQASSGRFRLRVRGSGHVLHAPPQDGAAIRGMSAEVGGDENGVTRSQRAVRWIRMNLVFALGEMGAAAFFATNRQEGKENDKASAAKRGGTLETLIQMALEEEVEHDQQLVRILLGAIADIAAGGLAGGGGRDPVDSAIAVLAKFLGGARKDPKEWSAHDDSHRLFTPGDMIRITAASGLMKIIAAAVAGRGKRRGRERSNNGESEEFPSSLVGALAKALTDPCGYVQWLALQCLLKIGSNDAVNVAIRAMHSHWFDATLTKQFTF